MNFISPVRVTWHPFSVHLTVLGEEYSYEYLHVIIYSLQLGCTTSGPPSLLIRPASKLVNHYNSLDFLPDFLNC
jgi:hypothetical protein